MHLPYFAFRKRSTDKEHSKDLRWTGLSFLNKRFNDLKGEEEYGIYEARYSLAIWGSDDWQWVAYGFDDTRFDGDPFEDKDFHYEIERDPVHEDPIASTEKDPADANMPLWAPREYYLMALKARSAQILKEWQKVVREMERGIEDYVCCHFSFALFLAYKFLGH